MGVSFSEQVLEPLRQASTIGLFECAGCGFRFCDPALAGNEHFYSELQSQSNHYYPVLAPEFRRTLQFARQRQLSRVMDIGCGAGAFLDAAVQAGLQACGLELNPQAAAVCRSKGHEVHSCLMSDFASRATEERFDLVTAFQVLEHVPDPLQFIAQAARLLKPFGYLAIAVPNERGVHAICSLDPHLWPPHHISRWRIQDLQGLAKKCHLEVISAGGDILHGAEFMHFFTLHNQLARALGRKPYFVNSHFARLLSFVYRKTGSKTDVFEIELGDILNKGQLATNLMLRPGDVITIPERLF